MLIINKESGVSNYHLLVELMPNGAFDYGLRVEYMEPRGRLDSEEIPQPVVSL